MLLRLNSAVFFLAISVFAQAQQSPAPPSLPKLTLQQAEALALQNHPQVQARNTR